MPKIMKGLLGLIAVLLVALLVVNYLPEEKEAAKPSPVVQKTESAAEKTVAQSTASSVEKNESVVEKAPEVARKPASTQEYKEGVHYRKLASNVPTAVAAGKIEVVEVFWYGCPHCYSLEPIVDSWKPSLSSDTEFVTVPGFFGPNIWKTHAQLYYTVANLGIVGKVHDTIFNEVQVKRNMLKNSDAMADFLNERFAVDKKEFIEQFNSFGVNHQLQQAFAKVRGYQLTGVPALVVDGRYVIEPGMAGSLNSMPLIADFLVNKVRNDRATEAKK